MEKKAKEKIAFAHFPFIVNIYILFGIDLITRRLLQGHLVGCHDLGTTFIHPLKP